MEYSELEYSEYSIMEYSLMEYSIMEYSTPLKNVEYSRKIPHGVCHISGASIPTT